MTTLKDMNTPKPLTDNSMSEENIRERARAALNESNKTNSLTAGLLALGGVALGGIILNNLLSEPTTRFKPSQVTTARSIGESIRIRRNDLGLTQNELAARSGTRERFISEIERGKETAEIGKVLDLLDALDLEIRLTAKA